MAEDHMMAVSHDEYAALVDERDRFKAIIDHIAESVIVRHICLPLTSDQGCCHTTWGCGVCGGEYRGYDRPDTTGAYDHKNWCPRKP